MINKRSKATRAAGYLGPRLIAFQMTPFRQKSLRDSTSMVQPEPLQVNRCRRCPSKLATNGTPNQL